jgi:hypothetical protein
MSSTDALGMSMEWTISLRRIAEAAERIADHLECTVGVRYGSEQTWQPTASEYGVQEMREMRDDGH